MMKKLLILVLAVLLCASVSEAFVYRMIGSAPLTGAAQVSGAAHISFAEADEGLGSVHFTVHPYTVGTAEASDVRGGSPIVQKIQVKKDAPHSPPITEEETAGHDGVTILVSESNSAGDIQLYATSNVEGNIPPSNVIRYDANPDVRAWTVNAYANSKVNTQINYVILIKYKDDAKLIRKTLNIKS